MNTKLTHKVLHLISSTTLPRLLSVLLLLALASCGGSGGPAGLQLEQMAGPVTGEGAPGIEFTSRTGAPLQPVDTPESISLPGLAELDRAASAAPGETLLFGPQFNPELPSANIQSFEGLLFSPAGSSFTESAFAVYSFNLPDYEGPNSFETAWLGLPAAGLLYYAVSDYGSGRWRWYAGNPEALLELPADGEFKSPAGNIHVAVFLQGTQACALGGVRWGGNRAPQAVLYADPEFCKQGYMFTLVADESADYESTTLNYEFDINGDGSFDVSNGDSPYIQGTIQFPGTHEVGVRVTDTEGLSAVATASIFIDTEDYDEVEDNDSVEAATQLPRRAVDWEGNIGLGGFDGDNQDIYRISVSKPRRIHVKVRSDEQVVFLTLYDATGTSILAESRTYAGDSRLDYRVTEPGNYLLALTTLNDAPAFDYSLDLHQLPGIGYNEEENNDEPDLADLVLSEPDGAFMANLGADGYDGDGSDWFKFAAPANTFFYVVAGFDPAAVDIDIRAFNDNLVMLDESESVDSMEQLGFVTGDEGIYYLNCVVKNGSPAGMMGDYTIDLLEIGPPPTASLVVTPDSGNLPLLLTFDGSGSAPAPGDSIVQLLWDVNEAREGYDLITNPDQNIFQVWIYAPGVYESMLTVMQDNGAFAHAYETYTVTGSADEVEPNDTPEGSQGLALPVTDFIGALGPGTDNGGSDDYYYFSPEASGTVNVHMDYEVVLGPIGIGLFTGSGDLLASDQVSDGALDLSALVTGGETYILLAITSPDFSGTTGYQMDIDMN